MNQYPLHSSASVMLGTDAHTAFQFLDDPRKLSTHMEKSSWMMAGSKMEMEIDTKQGQEIGSVIVLKGRMIGMRLFVQESVIRRVPNELKEWETFGEQSMLIIDQYKMGFRLREKKDITELEVYIDYALPSKGLFKFLAPPLARLYARWCTQKMALDAARYFPHQPKSIRMPN